MTSVGAERLLTEDEFLALPEDPQGRKLELFDGNVVALPHAGEEHNDCALRILLALADVGRDDPVGVDAELEPRHLSAGSRDRSRG